MARKRRSAAADPQLPWLGPVLALEDAVEAQREDMVKLAEVRLLPAYWRSGHQSGFVRGAAWAAEQLGAKLIHRPPTSGRPHGTVDEV